MITKANSNMGKNKYIMVWSFETIEIYSIVEGKKLEKKKYLPL